VLTILVLNKIETYYLLFWKNRDQIGEIETKNGEMVPIENTPKNRDRLVNTIAGLLVLILKNSMI
jgi:hypothetical protein